MTMETIGKLHIRMSHDILVWLVERWTGAGISDGLEGLRISNAGATVLKYSGDIDISWNILKVRAFKYSLKGLFRGWKSAKLVADFLKPVATSGSPSLSYFTTLELPCPKAKPFATYDIPWIILVQGGRKKKVCYKYQPDERSLPNTMLNDQNRWDQVSCRPPCSPQETPGMDWLLAQQREIWHGPMVWKHMEKNTYDTYEIVELSLRNGQCNTF